MSSRNGIATLRLLRFLQEEGACVTGPVADGSDRHVLVASANKRRMLFARTVLDAAISAGLLERHKEKISLTSLGGKQLKRAASININDLGGFAGQHRIIEERKIRFGEVGQVVAFNDDESPLTRLRRRRDGYGRPWIDDAAYQAGEKLRRDFTLGGLMQKVTASWDMALGSSDRKAGAGGKAELTDGAIDARRRLNEALDTVGPDLAGVLTDFCCFLKGLETIERDRKWPPRSAKLMLRTGLELLARFYGLEGRGPVRGRLQSWGAEGYRPEIGG